MSRALAVACTLGILVVAVAATGPSPRTPKPEVREFVFFAVLEGLYRDGVQNDMLDQILPRNKVGAESRTYTHFVYGCPLCMPALNAFLIYRERRGFYGWKGVTDTFGEGLDEGLRAQLAGNDSKQRMAGIHDLIQRWVHRRLDLMNLDESQRVVWQTALEDARKEGMRMLETRRAAGDPGVFVDGCAVCDGAVDASKDR